MTDDTELLLALANALVGYGPCHGMPVEAVAEAYYMWGASYPFDIDHTCRTAFCHPWSGGEDMMNRFVHLTL